MAWSPDGCQILVQMSSMSGSDFDATFMINYPSLEYERVPLNVPFTTTNSHPQFWDQGKILFQVATSFDPWSGLGTSVMKLFDPKVKTDEDLFVSDYIGEFGGDPQRKQILYTALYARDHYSLRSWDAANRSDVLVFNPPVGSSVGDIGVHSAQNLVAVIVVSRSNNVAASLHSFQLILKSLATSEEKTLLGIGDDALSSPTWSPNGEWIALVRHPFQTYLGEIVILAVDGSAEIVITAEHLGFIPVNISWSPVDNIILVSSLGTPKEQGLYIFDLSDWGIGSTTDVLWCHEKN